MIYAFFALKTVPGRLYVFNIYSELLSSRYLSYI